MKIEVDEQDETRAGEILEWLQRRGYNAKKQTEATKPAPSKKKRKPRA